MIPQIAQEVSIDERLKIVKEYARIAYHGLSDEVADVEMYFRVTLSLFYKIPVFSEYFDTLTLDQMIFEVEVIRLSQQTKEDMTQEAIKSEQGQKEINDMFDDWEEQDMQQSNIWNEMSGNVPDQSKVDEEVDNFLKTGKFQGE